MGKCYFLSSFLWLLALSGFYAQEDVQTLRINYEPATNSHKTYNPLFGEFYELPSDFKWNRDKSRDGLTSLHIELKSAAAVVLILEDLKLGFNNHLEIIDGRGNRHFYDGRHVSGKGILNTGLLPGKHIEIRGKLDSEQEEEHLAIIRRMVLLNKEDFEALPSFDEAKDFGSSDNCNININCSQGSNIQQEKRGIARIMLVLEEGMGWCSGSLINNTAEDFKPLFLTAYHCQDGYTPLFDFWRFDFNYEYENCSGGLDEPPADALTGCEFSRGRQASDFMLLEIQKPVPYSYRPYWNGWNRADQAASSLTMVHHPQGDIKKVTRFDDDLRIRSFPTAINWTNNVTTPANHHWEAPHTAGMFEVGSSGAPAMDFQGRIVGQLHGGVISCNSGVSYFGKLSQSWVDVQGDDEGLFRDLSPDEADKISLSGLRAPDSYCLGTQIYDQSNGTITDGSASDVYLPGTNCSFLIQIPNNRQQVRLDLALSDLGAGDSLFIYDGSSSGAPLLDVWTANTQLGTSILASGYEMFVEFVADDELEKQGFELQYDSEDIDLDVQVSIEATETESTVVYLFNQQFILVDSAAYSAAEPTAFESLFSIEENTGMYYLTARIYDPDLREGVSTLDLLRMQMIFREDLEFNDIYEWMAADIDDNMEINLADLIGMSRFVRRLEEAWTNQHYVQLYNSELLEQCEGEDWRECLRYRPVEYIEVNSNSSSTTGPIQIRFERLQEGDLNRSARF